MRNRMERLTAFPFSAPCVSHSCVEVIESQPKKSLAESNSARTIQLNGKMKSSFGALLPHLKPNISAGIQKMIKSFKNLSYRFQFYKAGEDGDEERDMEIGFPTDVQHVAHIGWEGFNSGSTTMKSWDKGPELLSLPSISLRQFELAMAAQTDGPL